MAGRFPATFFTSNSLVAQTKKHLNSREVMDVFTLAPGEYLIVPSTFRPDETASFILRILSKSETRAQYAQALHWPFFIIMLQMHIFAHFYYLYYLLPFFFQWPLWGKPQSNWKGTQDEIMWLMLYRCMFVPLNMVNFVLITSQPIMRETNQNDEESRKHFNDYSNQVFCLTQT